MTTIGSPIGYLPEVSWENVYSGFVPKTDPTEYSIMLPGSCEPPVLTPWDSDYVSTIRTGAAAEGVDLIKRGGQDDVFNLWDANQITVTGIRDYFVGLGNKLVGIEAPDNQTDESKLSADGMNGMRLNLGFMLFGIIAAVVVSRWIR